jgi:hypothetical protein
MGGRLRAIEPGKVGTGRDEVDPARVGHAEGWKVQRLCDRRHDQVGEREEGSWNDVWGVVPVCVAPGKHTHGREIRFDEGVDLGAVPEMELHDLGASISR